jgi:hypothetical protein
VAGQGVATEPGGNGAAGAVIFTIGQPL